MAQSFSVSSGGDRTTLHLSKLSQSLGIYTPVAGGALIMPPIYPNYPLPHLLGYFEMLLSHTHLHFGGSFLTEILSSLGFTFL